MTWLTYEEEKEQARLEKLIDWELRRQLAWGALILATFIGIVSFFEKGE